MDIFGLDSFMIRALAAGIGIALMAGPLGCFVVWRGMAYFGDTMAHSALLGIALGFLVGINPIIGIAATGIVIALLLVFMQQTKRLGDDTLLGIMAHSTLSLGLVVLSFMEWLRIDLTGYLFGDILAVNETDLVLIYVGAMIIVAILMWNWKALLAITVDEDLAAAEGISPFKTHLIFMLLIAGAIALAMKIVGVLLITSLLIIPAAAARRIAKTPEGMAIGAVILGSIATIAGLLLSLNFDTPSGPSIVLAASSLFFLSLLPAARK